MIVPFCAPSGTGKQPCFISFINDEARTLYSLIVKSTHHKQLKSESAHTDSYRYLQLNVPFLISSVPQEMSSFAQKQSSESHLVEGGRSLHLPSVILQRGTTDPFGHLPNHHSNHSSGRHGCALSNERLASFTAVASTSSKTTPGYTTTCVSTLKVRSIARAA